MFSFTPVQTGIHMHYTVVVRNAPDHSSRDAPSGRHIETLVKPTEVVRKKLDRILSTVYHKN